MQLCSRAHIPGSSVCPLKKSGMSLNGVVIPCMLRLYLRLTLAIQLLLYLHFVPKTTKQALEDVCAVSNQDTDHTYKAVNLLRCC